jgi:hypothetical protein
MYTYKNLYPVEQISLNPSDRSQILCTFSHGSIALWHKKSLIFIALINWKVHNLEHFYNFPSFYCAGFAAKVEWTSTFANGVSGLGALVERAVARRLPSQIGLLSGIPAAVHHRIQF